MCRDGNFRPHYIQTEDYSFAVSVAFDTPVETKGSLSQVPLCFCKMWSCEGVGVNLWLDVKV